MSRKQKAYLLAPKYYGIDTSIRDAFERCGFETVLHNYRTKLNIVERAFRKAARTLPMLRRLFEPVVKLFLDLENHGLISLLRKARPDLLFIIKGEFVSPRTVSRIKDQLKIPVVSYQWDDPFYAHADHQTYDRYRRENFARSMHLFDHIFVYDSEYLKQINDKGIENADLLPLATDLRTYKSVPLTEDEKKEYCYDVCFVGLPFRNRIAMFNNMKGIKLGVFGDQWEHHLSKVSGGYFRGKASGEKVLKLYSASKIVLNIHHPQSLSGPNTRTFDILACGSFEITDHKKDMEKLFKIGEEIVCFDSERDLIEKTAYYLAHPDERERIARKGFKKILSSHTWEHRVKELVSILSAKGLVHGN